MRPSPGRRILLLLLDPHAPWWASAGLWIGVALVGLVIGELYVPHPATDSPTRWTSIALRVASIALLLLAVVAGMLRREQALWYRGQLLRRGAGLCPNCGYALKGLRAERCPECGVDIAAAAEEAARMTGIGSRR